MTAGVVVDVNVAIAANGKHGRACCASPDVH